MQAININSITATVVQIAAERPPDLEEIAQSVANIHGKALLLFSKCHQKFTANTTLVMIC